MHLKVVDHNDSSDDEGEEEMPNDDPESQESDLGEEEEQMEEDEEELVDDDEQPDAEEPETDDARHPYPTPPPEDGSKMDPPKSMVPKPKASLTSLAFMAITKLASRSGSSLQAIITYLKDNGHEFKDPKKTSRLMLRALKVAMEKGEVVMVKRSFKLTDKQKNSSKAMEKMKAKKQKEKEKKAKAEQMLKEKAEKKEAKSKAKTKEKKAAKEKSRKPTERKTKQTAKKKESKIKDEPPTAKTAASAAAQALLETPKTHSPEAKKKPAKSKTKVNAELSEAGKSKKPRKSIGTLAQPKASRPKVKAVKKLVAGKGSISTPDQSSTDISKAQAMSTPQGPTKAKRQRKA
ncbi:histone H1-gamma, late [Drosophila biarmipes]|uniref:histone H1-gamma, late n=1 Tax=Drosophila biarmipes TaxID=125945 RepID=UPI0007E60E1A|nr:histone H1-gamma, late [Drosophila biarmipes]